MKIIFFLLLTFLICIKTFSQECSVRGIVVDDDNKPVSESLIYFGGFFYDDVDAIIVGYGTDENGKFDLKRACSKDFYYLFITSKIDDANTFVPISPPFLMQQGNYKDFPTLAGIKLTKQNSEFAELKIQTVYQKIRIKFQNEIGEELFPNFENALNSKFTIRNEKGKLVSYAYFYKENTFGGSSILMSLPEGKWVIELKQHKKKQLYPDKIVEIKRNQKEFQEVVLKMSKKKIKF